jgi:glycine/sarcosine N-methyltransferase
MGFYQQISKYYDYIFPTGAQQLNFIKQSAGSPPKKILDVACGSGGYSAELAKSGYAVTGIDLDAEMVNKAKEKAANQGLNVTILKCDMLSIQEASKEKFDLVFCIGNSLVHLSSQDEIRNALKQMHGSLEEGGSLILQIINYDRVVNYKLNSLPTIENDEIGLEFVRKYLYDKQKDIIKFNTVLTVENRNEKEVYENSIELLPLRSADMEKLLKEAGFSKIEFYGDFSRTPFDENSFMLVVRAE